MGLVLDPIPPFHCSVIDESYGVVRTRLLAAFGRWTFGPLPQRQMDEECNTLVGVLPNLRLSECVVMTVVIEELP